MIRLNNKNINTPEFFNSKFKGTLGMSDMERFQKLAKNYKGGSYVDVGCWDSPMPLILAERYPKEHIYALDFADEVVHFLGDRIPQVLYQLIGSCYSLPFSNGSVDYVVAGELIEHLEDPALFIKEALRVLKKDGWLAISTPHIEHQKTNRIGGAQHLWSFDRDDLQDLMPGCEIETLKEGGNLTWLAWYQK